AEQERELLQRIAQMDELERAHKMLREELTLAQASRSKSSALSDRMGQENRELLAQLATTQDTVEVLELRLEETKQDQQEDSSNELRRREEIVREFDAQQALVLQLSEENVRIKGELAEFQDGSSRTQDAYEVVRSEVVDLEQRNALLRTQLEQLDRGQFDTKELIDETERENVELRELLTEASERIERDDEEITDLRRTESTLTVEVTTLREDNSRLQDSLLNTQKRLQGQRSGATGADLAKLGSDLDLSAKREEQLRGKLDRAITRADEALRESERLRREAARGRVSAGDGNEREAVMQERLDAQITRSMRMEKLLDIAEKTHLADREELARSKGMLTLRDEALDQMTILRAEQRRLQGALKEAETRTSTYKTKLQNVLKLSGRTEAPGPPALPPQAQFVTAIPGDGPMPSIVVDHGQLAIPADSVVTTRPITARLDRPSGSRRSNKTGEMIRATKTKGHSAHSPGMNSIAPPPAPEGSEGRRLSN
ncbi:MAG: hypothetical protein ACI9MR_004993, partial [Myxococcota bacterium]